MVPNIFFFSELKQTSRGIPLFYSFGEKRNVYLISTLLVYQTELSESLKSSKDSND